MKIHVARGNQQLGQFSAEEVNAHLASGHFRPDDLAWWEGAPGWVRLDTAPGVTLPQGGPPPLPPGLPAMAAAGAPINVRTSGVAIASLVFGVLALFTGVTALLGLPLGIWALIRIKNSKGQFSGTGFAIAGIVCSAFGMMVILVLAGMLLPALSKAKSKAARIRCVNNLKQVGLAFRIFANDNDDKYPWKFSKFPADTVNMPWQHFMAMSNELGSAKILMCPADSQRLADQRMDFSTAPGMGLLDKKNAAISYTVGVEADERYPQVPLSHDRHVGRSDSQSIRIAPYAEGLNEMKFDSRWVIGTGGNAGLHDVVGNMALSDASVQQQATSGLQQSIRMGDESLRKAGRPDKQSISMLFP